MSLYGYPIKTTPFLDTVNGIILNNYYSAAPNHHCRELYIEMKRIKQFILII